MRSRSPLPFIVLLAVAACNRPHHLANAFAWSDSLPAGATLHLRDGNGDITVQPSPGASVTVTASKHWNRGREGDITFQTRRVGSDVYVCAMWRNSGTCGARDYRGARPRGGILTMFSIFRHRSDAAADFVVQAPAGLHLDVVTTLGDIVVEDAKAGVVGRTANGDVKATEVGGNVALTTSNGDAQASVASIQGVDSISLRTTNGDVHATLPADLSGQLELSTVNGDIRSDFPIPQTQGYGRRTIEATLGSSPRLVRLRTTNGDVVVTKRP
ncbi:MAG TPA: DUF4097 family beta strand repeat-containing protein [Gemmatimonadaceae bacterium]